MKKVLSAILAAAMLIAMLPAAFATEGEATDTFTGYEYVFTSESLPDELKDSSKYVQIGKFENTTTDTPLSAVSDPWKIAAHFYVKNIQSRPASGLSGSTTYPGFNVWTDTSKSHTYFAIEIKVGKGGTYVPSLSYFETEAAPKVKIWLVKGGTTSNNVNTSAFEYQAKASTGDDRLMSLYNYASKLGNGGEDKYLLAEELDMYGEFTQGDAAITKTFDELTLESGSYFLIFHKTGSQATSGDLQISLDSFSLTPVQDPIPEDEFNAVENTETITSYNVGDVSAVAYTVGTDTQDNTISVEAKDNGNGTYTLNAPTHDGYNFLYWKKGLTDKKDVITYKPTGFVYAPTAGVNNYVIAVYEKVGETTTAKAEFYNANGQFIKATDGSFPTATDIPSMAGYGDATGWQCYTDGKTYALTDSVTPNGIMLFVADYEDTLDTVNVNGNNVPFGTEISFTAAPATGKTFKCWTRTDEDGNTEIVSIEEDYKFRAYENCTVAEVDTEGAVVLPANTRKIVLDTFSVGSATALMAEFIGFKNDTVVEKGIMLGNNRIAMKSTGTQFTIIPDETGTYKGYAIVENEDDAYTLITDGEYTKQ